MAQKIKISRSIGEQIKDHFTNQSWLASQIGISEAQLSRKMKGKIEWTQDDLDKINRVLGTDFKI